MYDPDDRLPPEPHPPAVRPDPQPSLFPSESSHTPWDVDPDVALTPRGVVRQGLAWAQHEFFMLRSGTFRVCDPSAGSGVFGAEAMRAFTGALITGIEPAQHPWDWRRHYHFAYQCRFQDFPCADSHLIAGNPPFSQLCDFVRHGMGRLEPGGVMMYLGLLDWGQRGAEHEALWREYTPVMQARIPGSIGFQKGVSRKTGKPIGSDVRSYCWWVWFKGPNYQDTRMVTLPRLPSHHRRWTHAPGQEPEGWDLDGA